jgi:hypothetical protein
MNIRFCAITAFFIVLFLLSLTSISSAVDFAPINGNKKIEPEVIPYWDMGEPGSDPGWRSSTVSTSGHSKEVVDPAQGHYAAAQNKDTQFIEIMKILLLRMNFLKFGFSSYSCIWSR